MKKTILLFVMAVTCLQMMAQAAQKPVIIVFPGREWCINKGFTQDSNPKAPDFRKALQNDDVRQAIRCIEDLMQQRDYPLENLSDRLRDLDDENAMDIMGVGKDDADIVENDYDKLIRAVNADIVLNIELAETNMGPYKKMKFSMDARDAATSKTISALTPDPITSTADPSTLIKGLVEGDIDNFCIGLSKYFDRLFSIGREGTAVFKITTSCPLNMESTIKFNGEEGTLQEIIDYWFNENTVEGAYTAGAQSIVRCEFRQVRFPLSGKVKFGGKAKSLDMQGFLQTKKLPEFLAQFGVICTLKPVGIGKCTVLLGGN